MKNRSLLLLGILLVPILMMSGCVSSIPSGSPGTPVTISSTPTLTLSPTSAPAPGASFNPSADLFTGRLLLLGENDRYLPENVQKGDAELVSRDYMLRHFTRKDTGEPALTIEIHSYDTPGEATTVYENFKNIHSLNGRGITYPLPVGKKAYYIPSSGDAGLVAGLLYKNIRIQAFVFDDAGMTADDLEHYLAGIVTEIDSNIS